MDSLIKNVIYLGPSAALSISGLGIVWQISSTSNPALIILYTAIAVPLFYGSYKLAMSGFDSIERITKIEFQAKIDIEKEKSSRKSSEIHGRKEIENEKHNRDVFNAFFNR